MAKNNQEDAHQKMADKLKKEKIENGMARMPEFKTLDLTDDPEQVKSLITQIDAQANKEIAQFVGAIEDQRFVMIGRCFIHLKSICEKGQYKQEIEELGYSYEQVKKQVKVTETYIEQALSRKKGHVALLGSGMLHTMGRVFKRDELLALGDGKKVYGLRDKDLEGMTSREVISHIKAAKAERDEEILKRIKKEGQLSKSHDETRNLQTKLADMQDELDLLKQGPESAEGAHKVCSHIRSLAREIAVRIRTLKVLDHVPEAVTAGNDSISWALLMIETEFDLFSDVEPSDKKTKQLEKLDALFGYTEK